MHFTITADFVSWVIGLSAWVTAHLILTMIVVNPPSTAKFCFWVVHERTTKLAIGFWNHLPIDAFLE